MVINITLGLATLGRLTPAAACSFACAGRAAAACPNAEDPADRVIAAASGRVIKKIEKRRNMRLLWRRLLPRAPHLLVCLGRESLGGQRLGQRFVHDGLLRRQFHGTPQLRNRVVQLFLIEQGLA